MGDIVGNNIRRVLVTGSRNWNEKLPIHAALDEELRRHGHLVVVHGGAAGADAIAGQWARSNSVTEEVHPAQWGMYGKSAGYRRNKTMVDLGADICYAFPLGESRGTRACMRLAQVAGIPVVNWEDEAT